MLIFKVTYIFIIFGGRLISFSELMKLEQLSQGNIFFQRLINRMLHLCITSTLFLC